MDKMKIEIWSDIACPYCYIGKRKLETALNQFPNKDKVELVWHSYELNPSLPKKALETPFYIYFSENHGVSQDEAKASLQGIIDLAKETGLNYDFDNLVVANTSDALRLVKLAKETGVATEAEEVLFSAYFVEGKDISDRSLLVKLGVQIGLREKQIIEMLDSDKYITEIANDITYSENELNLEYIPFYLFNNKHIIQGSIPSDEYLEVLTKAYAEWEKDGISTERGDIISGQSCSIDGVCS